MAITPQPSILAISWPDANQHPYFYIGIYTAIALGTVFMNICVTIAQYVGALRASRILFKQVLVSVVRATMRWHDTTPQGRILNRFGKVSISSHPFPNDV